MLVPHGKAVELVGTTLMEMVQPSGYQCAGNEAVSPTRADESDAAGLPKILGGNAFDPLGGNAFDPCSVICLHQWLSVLSAQPPGLGRSGLMVFRSTARFASLPA